MKVDVKLSRAHVAFKSWCRNNRVYCSQPMFKPKMVPRSELVALGYIFEWNQASMDLIAWSSSSPPQSTCGAKIFKKNGDILFTLKAYNGRAVFGWLTDVVFEASQNDQFASFDSRFPLIALAMKLSQL